MASRFGGAVRCRQRLPIILRLLLVTALLSWCRCASAAAARIRLANRPAPISRRPLRRSMATTLLVRGGAGAGDAAAAAAGAGAGPAHVVLTAAALCRAAKALLLSDRAVASTPPALSVAPYLAGHVDSVLLPAYVESVLALWGGGGGGGGRTMPSSVASAAMARIAKAIWLSRNLQLLLRWALLPSEDLDADDNEAVGPLIRDFVMWTLTGRAALSVLGLDAVGCCPPGSVQYVEELALHGVQWACYYVFGYALHVLNRNAQEIEEEGRLGGKWGRTSSISLSEAPKSNEAAYDDALDRVRAVLF